MIRLALTAAIVLAGCSPKTPATTDEKAIAWLFARQAADGTWRSSKYDSFKSGRALTPFVLYALSFAPAELVAKHRAAIEKAFARVEVDETHATYSRALWVMALVAHKPVGWEARVESLVRELRETQLAERLGWSPTDPEYGGWDMGVAPARKPQCQRPDISQTAFAVEALTAAGAKPDDPALRAARAFARACLTPDGGAFFTPSRLWSHQNKAGERRAYGTATADALWVLRLCGADDEAKRAKAWIEDRFRPGGSPGFPEGGDRWDEALQYYWLFSAARAGVRKQEIHARLASLQRADGSWENALGLMKEDEPIAATGLALSAWWSAAARSGSR